MAARVALAKVDEVLPDVVDVDQKLVGALGVLFEDVRTSLWKCCCWRNWG